MHIIWYISQLALNALVFHLVVNPCKNTLLQQRINCFVSDSYDYSGNWEITPLLSYANDFFIGLWVVFLNCDWLFESPIPSMSNIKFVQL